MQKREHGWKKAPRVRYPDTVEENEVLKKPSRTGQFSCLEPGKPQARQQARPRATSFSRLRGCFGLPLIGNKSCCLAPGCHHCTVPGKLAGTSCWSRGSFVGRRTPELGMCSVSGPIVWGDTGPGTVRWVEFVSCVSLGRVATAGWAGVAITPSARGSLTPRLPGIK